MAAVSMIAARISIFPPHCPQLSMSIPNTRMSSFAQLIRAFLGTSDSPDSLGSILGTTLLRILECGANTP